ncbi:MAG: hypothetical protein K6C99_07025 [Lachnospiraceae bacterium]|nr:hypothetical protein [Lachnospiraceae bacterium]
MKDNDKKRKKKKKKMTFYKGLLIAFCSGLLVIAVLLGMLYTALARYEERVQAAKVPEVVTIPSLALGGGETTVSGGDAAGVEPSVSDDTVSGDQVTVSADEVPEPKDDVPSYPITEDEKMLVQKTAEDFTKAYAVFSLKKNASGATALSYVDPDSELHGRLASYSNDWGVTYSSDSFDDLEISDIRKISEAPAEYSCVVDCTYSVNNGANSYDLDFEYILKPNASGDKMMIEDMQNR